jgi:hypothetical protein
VPVTLVLPGAATDARAITGADTAAAPVAGPETGGTVAVPVADAPAPYGLLTVDPVFGGCEPVVLEPPAGTPPATTGTEGDAIRAVRTVGSEALAASASAGAAALAGATFATGVGSVAGSGTGVGVGVGVGLGAGVGV